MDFRSQTGRLSRCLVWTNRRQNRSRRHRFGVGFEADSRRLWRRSSKSLLSVSEDLATRKRSARFFALAHPAGDLGLDERGIASVDGDGIRPAAPAADCRAAILSRCQKFLSPALAA